VFNKREGNRRKNSKKKRLSGSLGRDIRLPRRTGNLGVNENVLGRRKCQVEGAGEDASGSQVEMTMLADPNHLRKKISAE
jgi:hypothetical protein